MSVMDRFATLLLIAMAITEAYAKSTIKKKKKKFPIGAIIGIIIVVVIIVIIVCVVLFLLKRKKSKAAKFGNVEAPGQGYAMNTGGPAPSKYEPVTTQPQEYQQQTNYQNQTPYGQGPPQNQAYGQGPPAQHGAAGDYYKP